MSIRILTVGAGGFASNYTRLFLDNLDSGKYEYSGVVEICDDFPYKDEFIEKNIPIYKTIEEFYSENGAELAFISTPPHFHAQQCIYAVNHGSDVLCEKPIATAFEDAMAICEASEAAGKFVGIGYQYSYAKPFLDLKRDILSGALGKPIQLKTMLSWPRSRQYYNRSNGWAGRVKDADGKLILDSVISNGAAHYLHNMLFLLGDTTDTSCLPEKYSAELLRANDIENFDAAVIRMETKDNVKLMIAAGHCVNINIDPIFDFQFEKASVYYRTKEHLTVNFSDGTIKDYGIPSHSDESKIWKSIDATESRAPLPCVAKTAMPHNIIINNLYEKCEVQDVPRDMISFDEENELSYVNGLSEALTLCFEKNKMLSEIGWDWVKTTDFQLDEKYIQFLSKK